MSADDVGHSLKRMTDAVALASGWGPGHCSITFRYADSGVGAAVEICGAKTSVSAWGKTHCEALVALLQRIESHYHEVGRWYATRRDKTRGVLDELQIYYVRIP